VGKNIVICADGTSNDPKSKTHVWQLHRALGQPGLNNVCFYRTGLGTDFADFPGLAFGTGIDAHILDCYDFLASHWEPRDHVYCFGFSRGAYTVRSFANFVSMVGLVPKDEKKVTIRKKKGAGTRRVKRQQLDAAKAYGLYRINGQSVFQDRRDSLASEIGLRRCGVHCIGVFDTVGAVGVKLGDSRKEQTFHRYHRTDLAPDLRYAFQALAIDDLRKTFWPHQFAYANRPEPSGPQTVEEVWFAGMHSDVGGGYTDGRGAKTLSNVALHWMASKLPASLGLKLPDSTKGDALGRMHDSGEMTGRRLRRPPPGALIHQSLVDRIAGPIPPGNAERKREPGGVYRPKALEYRRGSAAVPEGFKLDIEAGPDFGLDRIYRVVDKGYAARLPA